jgi:hypoxanthine phosphoribosyltransferase
MKSKFRCDVVSWSRIERLARDLAHAIRASGFQPDLIVAIARGGYVPARLLADALGVTALTGLRIVHYTAGARRQRRARLVEPLRIAVTGQRVLVVDDVADTGDTYVVAMQHIARRQPAVVRSAALHYKVGARFVPDYYAARLTAWRWINYPWARLEDIDGFLARMRPPPETVAEATRRLAREFGMRVARSVVAEVFSGMGRPASPRRHETVRRGGSVPRAPAGTRSRHRSPR